MTDATRTPYQRPQDKHGLLNQKTQATNGIVEELEMILVDYSAYKVLDCACGDGLYASMLAESGKPVFAADESADSGKRLKKRMTGKRHNVPFKQADIFSLEQAYPEKFNAILCMNNELARFEQETLIQALRALLARLDSYGILIVGVSDFAPVFEKKEAVIPLMLGVKHEGMRVSVIQSMQCTDEDTVGIHYIYHMEDLSTGTVTVDWESAECTLLTADVFRGYLKQAGGHLHKKIDGKGECLFVCGNEPPRPYLGPKSYPTDLK